MQTHLTLNNGKKIPVLGLGTWKSKPNEVGGAITYAITKAGYRHVDCASIYGNEKEIGEAFHGLLGKLVKREEVFVTGKLWNTDHETKQVEKACKKSLFDLQLDYLDLYLMHWGIAFKRSGELEPMGKDGKVVTINVSVQETWRAMENLVKKGLVKSIGVANFTTVMLVDLLTYATLAPVMNQIELHPYNSQQELIDYCHYKKIAVTAYSPLGHKSQELFDEPIIKKLASKYKKSPQQVLLNWGLSRGTIVIPKSITPSLIKENSEIFDFSLSQEEVNQISLLNRNRRFVHPRDWWGIPYFL